jgi:hypothetical protein
MKHLEKAKPNAVDEEKYKVQYSEVNEGIMIYFSPTQNCEPH